MRARQSTRLLEPSRKSQSLRRTTCDLCSATVDYTANSRNCRIIDEIGFGPGLAIRALVQTTAAAFIAGVDGSLVMLHQAGKRNAAAIRSGRVALQHGSVAHLPYPDATFHKVLAVNSLHHWPAPIANLCEVRRVLKPNGLVAIVEQPRGAATDEQVRVRADELATLLVAAGFQNIRQTFQPMCPAPSIGVLGMND
jgi:ubiquinone/menaquinone biosynthesis C-methylase UbiE